MSDETPSPGHPSLPAEALGARPGTKSVFFKVLSGALSGGLLVLLFVEIIPAVGDFSGTWESIASLSPWVVVVMFLMAVAIRLLLAEAYAVLTPGLAFGKSLIAREASSAVSNVIPGPSGTATQFVILHSWGVGAERFARVTVVIGLTTNVLIFVAPGIFFAVWALLGMPASYGGADPWLFGLVAIAVSALAIVVVGAIARSVRLAELVGRIAQACVNPVRRLFGKSRVTTWPEQSRVLRAQCIDELKVHGAALLWCIGGGYLLNGVLLVVCIWASGVSDSQLPLSLGLMIYSVGRIATIVSITPGGVGVVEIVYTAVYVYVLGDSAHNAVVAGVLIYRMLTYLLPIITGAVAYLVWRLMRLHEIHEQVEAEAA